MCGCFQISLDYNILHVFKYNILYIHILNSRRGSFDITLSHHINVYIDNS